MFLKPEQLEELTGRERPTAQIRWLKERGYPYEPDADGRPKVLISVVESRLGERVAKRPQLRLGNEAA